MRTPKIKQRDNGVFYVDLMADGKKLDEVVDDSDRLLELHLIKNARS